MSHMPYFHLTIVEYPRFCLIVVGGKCPDNPRGAIRKYQGSCYEFIKDDVSHPHARELCHKHNGHLVHIENKEKEVGNGASVHCHAFSNN